MMPLDPVPRGPESPISGATDQPLGAVACAPVEAEFSPGVTSVDLYLKLGTPLGEVSDGPVERASSDPRPDPLTIETRQIETTDEAGLMATFGCVGP